jgi:excisionase family DNA binding protein
MPSMPIGRRISEFDEVVSLRDAAAILDCHVDTLRNLVRKGKLAVLRISTRRLGIRRSELERYLTACERP